MVEVLLTVDLVEFGGGVGAANTWRDWLGIAFYGLGWPSIGR